MSSPGRVERETSAPPVHSPEHGKEAGEKDGDCQQPENQDEWKTTERSENKDNGDIQEDVSEEEVSTSLSVGDGRHLVDLGSPSEFIVDEDCIFQLLRSCRICNRYCQVKKKVHGLKLTVSQTCRFCQSHFIWTNLQDENEEDDDFSDFSNGKDRAHGQLSPGSNTS